MNWLVHKAMPWNKKTGIKTLTSSFKKLLVYTKNIGAIAIGSKDMPICIIPKNKRVRFSEVLKELYGRKISDNFLNWIKNSDDHLICVWIAGFKPRGDDSRPDRGLVPLARMIFGFEGIKLISFVYGPAAPETWQQLKDDMWELANSNGLWEAIIRLSEAILVDSSTSLGISNVGFLVEKPPYELKPHILAAASTMPFFGEHDVDTVLHMIFSSAHDLRVFESLCNPPGGDWSGISLLDFDNKIEYRWTSLPRVSGQESKRPDHIIEFFDFKVLLSIESKDTVNVLENNIGPRLIKYVNDLINIEPTSYREYNHEHWNEHNEERNRIGLNILSAGSFRYRNSSDLSNALSKGVDIALGLEFHENGKTTLHILSNERAADLIYIIDKLVSRLNENIMIEFHG